MREHAIQVQGVTKRYGQLYALRGIDLEVPRGMLFGLLGPNGAGKSTLIKALVGSLRPTSGSMRVLGLDPLHDRATLREQVGYMPQSPALYQAATTSSFSAARIAPSIWIGKSTRFWRLPTCPAGPGSPSGSSPAACSGASLWPRRSSTGRR
jgi:ABC-2 type transport system ATP-binding protein